MTPSYDQRTVTNTARLSRGKDGILMVVSKTVSLIDETGGKTVRVGLVVDQLSVNVVVDVPGVLQSRRAAEHVVTNCTEERLCSFCGGFELGGSVHIRDVRLESLSKCGNGSVLISWWERGRTYRTVSPGLEGAVVSRFDGFDGDVLVSTERRDNRCFVCKSDFVVWVGGVKTLEKGNGRVEDHGTFTASLGVDAELVSVDDIRFHTSDVGRGGASHVDRAKEGPELVRLGLRGDA